MSTKVFFTAFTPETGRELWVTDGTAPGTRMVSDINPGSGSGLRDLPGAMADLGDGRVVFAANDGVHGRELWVSDGTEAGTELVKDIRPGGSSDPYNLVPLGLGRAIFVADDGVHGRELWLTDGTQGGTRLLADINPGSASSFAMFTAFGFREAQALGDGRAVFIADDGVHGRELWVTDGTGGGTRMVVDIRPGPERSIDFRAEFPDEDELVDSTHDFFFDIAPGLAVFFADDGTRGRDLWVTDGTAAGTEMLVDQDNVLPQSWPEANWSVDYIRGVGPLWDPRTLPDGRLIYNAVYSPEEGPNRSTDLGTDGTVSGTVRLGQTPHAPQPAPDPVTFRLEADEGFYPASFRGGSAQLVDGRLVYGARTDYRVTEPLGAGGTQVVTYSIGDLPWITDGTLEGTQPLVDPFPDSDSGRVAGFTALPDGRVLFLGGPDPFPAVPDTLFVTDGSAEGTLQIAAGMPDGFAGFQVAFPNGAMLGYQWDGGLWFTDGTPEGTAPVPGAEVRFLRPEHFLQLGPEQWLFDVIREPTGANELWVTDGTPQGTAFVTDDFDLARLDRPSFTPLGDGQALLTLRDADHGREPWLFDVADGSLELLADLNPGTASSSPAGWLVAQGGQFPAVLAGQLFTPGGVPMAEMALSLRLADGSRVEIGTDSDGSFAFEAVDLAGAVLEGPAWTAAEGPAITTADALEALRMAVGLSPTWGPAAALDFIAADVNGDGRVSTSDALEILRVAVGLPSDHEPRWVFVDADRDFGEVDRTSVPTDIDPDLTALSDIGAITLTAFLTGNLQELF